MSDLRKIREAAGLPQIRLAQQANVSRFRLYRAECGALALTPEERERVNQVLAPAIAAAALAIVSFQNAPDSRKASEVNFAVRH
jgi:predicted transcriptional regulator